MIRILHLTDFHLNPKNLRDWNDYVKDAMITKLGEEQLKKKIDLVVFTGDMIDMGGKEYESPEVAFNLFRENVITPILTFLELPINNFLIIPGNHDVVRKLDSEREETGNIHYFKKAENVSNFIIDAIKKSDYTGMKRMEDYKKFESSLYPLDENVKLTMFGSSFKLKINGVSVGVCCLNSSWRCYNNNDSGNLLIGEDQLVENTKFINACDIKIALVHHPLDNLAIVEKNLISNHIYNDFNLLFSGHTHETLTSVTTGFTGTIFINIAPSGVNDIRSDSRTFANGFTIIDYDKIGKKITCQYLRYNHNKKLFVPNNDASKGDDGISKYDIPNEQSAKNLKSIQSFLENIREDHFKEMDEYSMGARAEVMSCSIKDAYVLPPIDQGSVSSADDPALDIYSITQIVQSKTNLIFFGNQESGKTVLLYRLIREYVDEFEYLRKVPVYIDFEEIGNKEIVTCIKEYLRCSTADVKYLIEQNQLVILIDNLKYSLDGEKKDQTNKLHHFVKENQEIQIIATGEHDILGILPDDYIKLCRIPFLAYFIRNLKSKEIKSLMKLWMPEADEQKTDDRLDKLVSSFNSYALPSTAMSVSLFLWSTENSSKPPINNAVLMEIYIEIILEKINKENIYRGTFDFTNKMQLLAKIAQEMLLANEHGYSIQYSKFVGVIEDYLKNLVGFTHDPDVLVKYFLNRKIFVKYQGNRIKFAHSCFFHFFIGKRMEFDDNFKDYVLDESRYFEFPLEIDYYTGLKRSDKSTLETILNRFEKHFQATDFILDKIEDFDKYFTPPPRPNEETVEAAPVARNIEIAKITENRPNNDLMEKYYNNRLAQTPNSNNIEKKGGNITLERLLIIMSNVLRNSEGVEDLKLKKRAYDLLIKYSMTFMVIYKESLINYVIEKKTKPPIIPAHISLDYFITNIPLSMQLGLYKHLGTQKLAAIVADKINTDRNSGVKSNIESFLSVALYSDFQGPDFEKYFNKFIKQLKTNTDNYITCDYSFFKLIDYYYRRTKNGSTNEEMYLDLLSELRIRSQKLPKRMKEQVKKMLSDGKKKFQKSF